VLKRFLLSKVRTVLWRNCSSFRLRLKLIDMCLTLRLKLIDRWLAKVLFSKYRSQTWRNLKTLWSCWSGVRPVRVSSASSSPRRAGRPRYLSCGAPSIPLRAGHRLAVCVKARWICRGFPGVEAKGRRRREGGGEGMKHYCGGREADGGGDKLLRRQRRQRQGVQWRQERRRREREEFVLMNGWFHSQEKRKTDC
jgi:hypothetical protein